MDINGNRTSYIFLNGGLGNQMFGLAAAMYASHQVVILGGASVATCRNDGMPEVFNLKIGENISFSSLNPLYRPALKKLHNFLLTSELNSRKHVLFRFSAIIKYILRKLFRILSRDISLIVSENVGYTDIPIRGSKVLIGYFQSCRWLDDVKVKLEMQDLFREIDRRIISLVDSARTLKPLMIHVRLGDYKNNQSIGALTQSYFSRALQAATAVNSDSVIWIFSDEPILAKRMLSSTIQNRCRWISEEFELSAEETLALMRYGGKFIISNSTFSWWAAALSVFEGAQVFYPDPWFANGETPRELIPRTWIPISRLPEEE